MKKNFEQPELMVVRMNNNDIITESSLRVIDGTTISDVNEIHAADRFRDFEDYSY